MKKKKSPSCFPCFRMYRGDDTYATALFWVILPVFLEVR